MLEQDRIEEGNQSEGEEQSSNIAMTTEVKPVTSDEADRTIPRYGRLLEEKQALIKN